MSVIDHLIDNFDVYIDWAFNDFYKEWKSGKYKNFTECPSYYELRTLLDSVNSLRKYMGWGVLGIKQMIRDRE